MSEIEIPTSEFRIVITCYLAAFGISAPVCLTVICASVLGRETVREIIGQPDFVTKLFSGTRVPHRF